MPRTFDTPSAFGGSLVTVGPEEIEAAVELPPRKRDPHEMDPVCHLCGKPKAGSVLCIPRGVYRDEPSYGRPACLDCDPAYRRNRR